MAEVAQRDQVYRALQNRLSLTPQHKRELEARGLRLDTINEWGFRSVAPREAMADLAANLADLFPSFTEVPGCCWNGERPWLATKPPALLLFNRDLNGRIRSVKMRLDRPADPADRYRFFSSASADGPSADAGPSWWGPIPAQSAVIRVAEGAFKALMGWQETGIPGIAAGSGVGTMAAPEVLAWLAELKPREVRFCPDADAFGKEQVRTDTARALRALIDLADRQGFVLKVEVWSMNRKPEMRPKGLDDALVAGEAIETLTPAQYLSEMNAPPAPVDEWGPALPLTEDKSAEPFPMEALGKPGSLFRKYIEDLSEFAQSPPEFGVLTALVMAAAMTRKRVRVASGRGRTMPINLHTLMVDPSAVGKSTIFEAISAPVKKVQKGMRKRFEEGKLARQARIAELESDLAALSKDDPQKEALRTEIAKLKSTADGIPPKLMTSDPSSEVIEVLLKANQGCIAILNPDAREFIEAAAGAYRNGVANLKPLLSGFSGEDWQTERATREGVEVFNPFVSMALFVQPSTIESIAKKKDFVQRGVLGRMLMAWPPPRTVVPPSPWDRQAMPASSEEWWEKVIQALAAIETEMDDEEPKPRTLEMSPGAVNRSKAFWDWSLSESMAANGILSSIPETGRRLAELAQRVAAGLHLIDTVLNGDPLEKAIRADTFDRAVAIVRWTLNSVMEVHFSAGGARMVCPTLVKVWGAVKAIGKPEVTVREVHRKLRTPEFRTVDPVRKAIKTLEGMGYLRPVSSNRTPGRPLEVYQVRPDMQTDVTKGQNSTKPYGKGIVSVTPPCDRSVTRDRAPEPPSTLDPEVKVSPLKLRDLSFSESELIAKMKVL